MEQQTSEESPVTLIDIVTYLSGERILADIRTVARDIELIIEAGSDVVCIPGRPKKYYIDARFIDLKKYRIRQKQGILLAKTRGVRFGRPHIELPDNFAELATQWECGKLSICEFISRTGMKRTTLYRRLREHQTIVDG